MKRHTTNHRPSEVPASWRIFNAPRPLVGNTTWRGAFLSGIFYAAVDPDGVHAQQYIDLNYMDAAVEIIYVTQEQALDAYLRSIPKEMLRRYWHDLTPEQRTAIEAACIMIG